MPETPRIPSIEQSSPYVILHNGIPATTSLAMSEFFGKRHDNILQDIKRLLTDCHTNGGLLNFQESSVQDFFAKNFIESSYLNQQNKEQPMYILTRDAFALLAMGFTGKKNLCWKIAYIEAFNALEKELFEGTYKAFQKGRITGMDEATRAILGKKRVDAIAQVLLWAEEGISHQFVGRCTGMSRYAVARIRKRYAFLRPVYRAINPKLFQEFLKKIKMRWDK